jgi:hypothetical protein
MSNSTTQNDLPHHIEDGFPALRRGPSNLKAVMIPTLTGLLIGVLFVIVFLAAFHAPEPYNLPVGMVGASQQIDRVEQALETNAPGSFEFTTYDSAADAQAAIEDRTTFGAYIMSEDGKTAQLLYAGANGPGVTGTLEGAFGAVAAHSHVTLETQDVVPSASGDTRGLGIFYAGFGIVLGAFLIGLISAQMAPVCNCAGACSVSGSSPSSQVVQSHSSPEALATTCCPGTSSRPCPSLSSSPPRRPRGPYCS